MTDALSRLPQKTGDLSTAIEEIQVTVKQVAQRNPILAKVLHYVKTGWPEKVASSMSPYF